MERPERGGTDMIGRTADRPTGAILAVLAVLAVLVTVGTVTGSAATADAGTGAGVEAAAPTERPAFVVELSADGSATVTTVYTYDLTTDDERAAFRSLRDDDSALANLTARYADRMAAVAAAAENETGREMAISDPVAELRTVNDGDTGIIALSVTWDGLAAVEGDRLAVGEPFASGFEPDRAVLLVAPDGYRFAEVSPAPSATGDDTAEWAAGTDLTGFAATLEPDPDATTAPGTTTTTGGGEPTADQETTAGDATSVGDGTTASGDGTADGGDDGGDDEDGGGSPGPGVVGAVAALVVGLALLRRR
jgi:MYXO-CTERM domain-containing protein